MGKRDLLTLAYLVSDTREIPSALLESACRDTQQLRIGFACNLIQFFMKRNC
jgi:hypothetical protein